jgi:hypothetical protein
MDLIEISTFEYAKLHENVSGLHVKDTPIFLPSNCSHAAHLSADKYI